MTDYEVERALGYTPCVCGVIDGTWHPECYRSLKQKDVAAAHKRAYAAGRRYLKKQAEKEKSA